MCCFTNDAEVHNTQIFARGQGPLEFLAYQMDYTATQELAMVLPLPTPPHASEDAVQFVDLADYADFFQDLQACFPPVPKSRGLDWQSAPTDFLTLVVHMVGSFEASFVPHPNDFARLDPRFRLPDGVWDQLTDYLDYGFAVFKLRPDAQTVHPMALAFLRRDPTHIFFPTVHIHHHVVEPEAAFDHTLYWQPAQPQNAPWEPDTLTLTHHGATHARPVQTARTKGLFDEVGLLYKLRLTGLRPNRDVVWPDP